jgi:hypothetical protein
MKTNRQKDNEEIQNIIKYYENNNQKFETAKLGDVWFDTDNVSIKVCNKILNGIRYWSDVWIG